MEERVRAMRTIWTQAKPEFNGAHVKFGPMMSWPKPVQKPLPVIVGGMYPHGARRAIAFGDGWMPHARRPEYGEKDVLAHLPAFREMVKAAGRDPASMPVTTFGTPPELDLLKRYRDAGVARAVFSIGAEDQDKTLATLDKLASLVRQAA
jgi:alkanesulfonate monooxygenase SsuD/methylene tetrahydromethanopterin reductase-like flavin-dependent oxidoreductase (luciferase family)